nr:hypothetical protein RCYEFQYI_RCYEFQYI_CDS_0004 [Microvirus sp.]
MCSSVFEFLSVICDALVFGFVVSYFLKRD